MLNKIIKHEVYLFLIRYGAKIAVAKIGVKFGGCGISLNKIRYEITNK